MTPTCRRMIWRRLQWMGSLFWERTGCQPSRKLKSCFVIPTRVSKLLGLCRCWALPDLTYWRRQQWIRIQSVRNTVIWILGHGGGVNNEAITRLLIVALKDPNAINRDDAATFLSGRDPVLAIPALIQALKDYSDFPTVSGVAKGLGSYGPAAKAAAPLLFSIYTNQVATSDTKSARDWGVELMWGLRAIDPETARKAGEFLINNVPLNYARNEYSVTKLPNGKELIAGGYIDTDILPLGNNNLSSAELLDPTTGKWTETGKMKIARHGHSAILQPDGEVLVSGGNQEILVVERFRNFNKNRWETNYMENSRPVLSAELYNPATGIVEVFNK